MSLNYKTSIDIVNFHYAEITKSNNTIKYVDDFIIKSEKSINIKMVLDQLKYQNDCKLFLIDIFKQCGYEDKISENLNNLSLEKKSFINFIRYFNFFEKVFYKRDFIVDLNDSGFLNLKLMSKNNKSGYLDLTFSNNGKVNFLILDREYDPKERKTFVLRGYIETSDRLKKSYKINRLLSILHHMDAEKSLHAMNYIE